MPATLPTRKADIPPLIEREVNGAEFLSLLLGPSATDEDLETVGRAWNVSQNEIDSIKALPPADHNEEALAREIRTAVAAAKCEAAINQLGKVLTGAILTATPEQLITWTEAYESNLDANYREQIRVNGELARLAGKGQQGTPEWDALKLELLDLRETFDRQAGFLWECHEMSGLNTVLAAS